MRTQEPWNAGPYRRKARRRWPLGVGLALSALVHALILVVASDWFVLHPPAMSAGKEAAGFLEAMHLVSVAPVSDAPPAGAEPVPRPERDGPAAPLEAEAAPRIGFPSPSPSGHRTAEPPIESKAPTASAADRLRPRFRDPRLSALRDDLVSDEASPADHARDRLRERIADLNDSDSVARASAPLVADWTLTSPEGQRWGISTRCVHLGRISLPFVIRLGRPMCPGAKQPPP